MPALKNLPMSRSNAKRESTASLWAPSPRYCGSWPLQADATLLEYFVGSQPYARIRHRDEFIAVSFIDNRYQGSSLIMIFAWAKAG
jgi:hypothetical protein